VARRLSVSRFEVHQVDLEPTRGSETRKSRPCLIVSPDEMNPHLRTVIVAPMTSHIRALPTRVSVSFRGTDGQVVLDQIRTVDKARLVRRLGTLEEVAALRVLEVLAKMFAA
jgi:mRNA interferase MazF